MKTDQQNISQLWADMQSNRERYKPIWDDIAKYTGISVQPDYMWNNKGDKSKQLDEYIDDPTAALSVNQSGDYLIGIMWGTGDKVVDIIPSRYVLELVDEALVSEWYDFISDQNLYHMNHSQAGLHTSLRPYAYGQQSFGTSGIGCFPNKDFINRIADNALVFREYGIDNTCLDEGKSGTPEIVGAIYHWSASNIIGEICMMNGEVNTYKYAKLPKKIRDAYDNGNINEEFDIVCLVFPRHDFNPKYKGKRGARYRGVWFMNGEDDNSIFHEEDFAEKPISMARAIKVRGERYGRAAGTMLLSSIRANNYILGNVIEILEKMANPALGMWNNALFGDSVLDSSAGGLTIFNNAMAANGQSPMFQMHDVGDPSALVQFLMPYLNDKITTAFKVDTLLDFNSAKDMTATESLQRYVIRGKSLSGMLQQQKIECLEPICRRSISILYSLGELGVDPVQDPKRAQALVERGKQQRVIPEAVLEVIKSGRPWYELKFNNELEKLTRTEAVQNLVQILQTIVAIAGVYPDIIEGVNWYKLLKDINDNLDYNNQVLIPEKEFKEKIASIAQTRQAAIALQAGQTAAVTNKDQASAMKQTSEAKNVGR